MDIDPSKLTPMGQLNLKNYMEGKAVLEKLEEMTKDPMRYNTEVLMKILRDNKDTEYGRKYGFADIHSIEEYQRRVPITRQTSSPRTTWGTTPSPPAPWGTRRESPCPTSL